MIVDFHVHCFPDDLAKRAIPKLEEAAGMTASFDGTLQGLKYSMREAGINFSVIQPIATKPSQTRTINDWSSAIQNNSIMNNSVKNNTTQECILHDDTVKDEQIVAFGSIHPDYGDWKDELKRIRDLGLRGIKYHPDYQSFFVDEERMLPVYDEIFNLGLILLFHAGVDIGLTGPDHCTPRRLLSILKSCSGGKIIAAHMGGFRYWDDVLKYLLGEDIYFDTSYGIGWMSGMQAKSIISKHGYQKILFATDTPWSCQKEEVERLKKLGLEEDVERAIFGGNARRLLSI